MSSIKFDSNMDKAIAKIREGSKEAATRAGIRGEELVKEKLTGERSGRTYTVPGTNTTYTASAPGEPPAQRTGQLRQNITWTVNQLFSGNYEAVVGTDLKYGPWLEFGTNFMKARPFLRPALKENEKELKNIMGGRWFD
jgi:HK97 gp10 family phage protein